MFFLFRRFIKPWRRDKALLKSIKREFEMPKIKTNRGAAKRFKRNAAGNFKRSQSHLRHILTKKSSKRKRQLGEMLQVHANDVRAVRRMMPYS